jgi:PAS domain S-box-containing protein
LLLFTLILVGAITVMRQLLHPASDEYELIALSLSVASWVVVTPLFFLNKRGYYRLSAYILTIFATVALTACAVATVRFAEEGGGGYVYFYYMIISVIGATTFLSIKAALTFTLLNMVVIFVAGILGPAIVSATHYSEPLIFNMFMSAVIVSMGYYRERLERERRARLVDSEMRYRIISESISDFAYSCSIDEQGEFHHEWITESAARVTGYAWDDLRENPSVIATLYHPDDLPIAKRDTQQVVERGISATGEYRMVARNGDTRWVRVHRRPIRDASGKLRVSRLYCVVQDITEHKKAENEHVRLTLERERLGFVSQFVMAISHEFRGALANIETSRYIIQRTLAMDTPTNTDSTPTNTANNTLTNTPTNTPTDISVDTLSETREILDSRLRLIQQTVFRLAQQLENLNAVSSLTSPQMILSDLYPIVEAVALEFHEAAAAQGVELRVVPYTQLPRIPVNRQEIKRALRQLIDNAIRYTTEGGVVLVRVCHDERFVYVDVRDTGVGITQAEQARIFDLFYKVDSARSANGGGVGLGLSIVKMIAEAHGGRVTVDSEPDNGSSFTLALPLNHDPKSPVRVAREHQSVETSAVKIQSQTSNQMDGSPIEGNTR